MNSTLHTQWQHCHCHCHYALSLITHTVIDHSFGWVGREGWMGGQWEPVSDMGTAAPCLKVCNFPTLRENVYNYLRRGEQ